MSAVRMLVGRVALMVGPVAACGPSVRATVVPPPDPAPRDSLPPPPAVVIAPLPAFEGMPTAYSLQVETRSVEDATQRSESALATFHVTLVPSIASASRWQVRGTARRARPDSADSIDSLPSVIVDEGGRLEQVFTPSPCRLQPVSPLFLRHVLYRRSVPNGILHDTVTYETCTPGGRSRVSAVVSWILPSAAALEVKGRVDGRVAADSTRGFPMRLEGSLTGSFTQWRHAQQGVIDSVAGVVTLEVTTRANQLRQHVTQRVQLRGYRVP